MKRIGQIVGALLLIRLLLEIPLHIRVIVLTPPADRAADCGSLQRP